jgi:hypothetical protein
LDVRGDSTVRLVLAGTRIPLEDLGQRGVRLGAVDRIDGRNRGSTDRNTQRGARQWLAHPCRATCDASNLGYHMQSLSARRGTGVRRRDPAGSFRRGRPSDPGPVSHAWTTPRWLVLWTLMPMSVITVAGALILQVLGRPPWGPLMALVVGVPFCWLVCLRQRLELTQTALVVRTIRWRWLPREALAYAHVDYWGIGLRTRTGQEISCTVIPTRSLVPGTFELATQIRDVVNGWAGVSEPQAPVIAPPPHDWSHRTDSGAGS